MSQINGEDAVSCSAPPAQTPLREDSQKLNLLFCTTCSKQASSLEFLREHISAHHLSYFPYQCSTCKNSLASMSLLKEHCFLRDHPEQVNELLDREQEKQLDLMLNHMLHNQSSVNKRGEASCESDSPTRAFTSLPTGTDSRKRKAADVGDYNGINMVNLESLYSEFVARESDLKKEAAYERNDVQVFIEDFVVFVLKRVYGDALKHCTKKQKYVNKNKYCVPTRLADDIYAVLEKNGVAAQYTKIRQLSPVILKQDTKSFIHSSIDKELSRAKRR